MTSSNSKKRVRPYDEKYMEYGFTFITVNNEQRPQCVICMTVLSSHSMKPALLRRHLVGNHPELKDKDKEFFERKHETSKKLRLDKPGGSLSIFKKDNEAGMQASYIISQKIAKAKKPHTIAENLILPCMAEVVELMCGKEAAKKISNIPLSNDTISRRINDLSKNIEEQVITELKNCSLGLFSLQLDESTDIKSLCQLLVYVRYFNSGTLKEEFLFCKNLETYGRGEDIFKMLDDYFNEKGLDWQNICGICTDGAASMIGKHRGFQSRVRNVTNDENVIFMHCMIHKEVLASKNIPECFQQYMKEVIKVINFIKSSGALNSRLFEKLCIDNDSDYSSLLFYAETRWLSRGKAFKRVYLLRNEIKQFFEQKNKKTTMFDNDGMQSLSFLIDLFEKLKKVNLSLQGQQATIIDLYDKISALKLKLSLWKQKISENNYTMFENLNAEVGTGSCSIQEPIIDHLTCLENGFQDWFPNLTIEVMQLARNPFSCNIEHIGSDDIETQEEFADFINDSSVKELFDNSTILNFWCKMADTQKYIRITKLAAKIILAFPTSYLCEQGFSKMVHIKSKFRSKLNLEDDLRVASAKTSANIKDLLQKKQPQGSH